MKRAFVQMYVPCDDEQAAADKAASINAWLEAQQLVAVRYSASSVDAVVSVRIEMTHTMVGFDALVTHLIAKF